MEEFEVLAQGIFSDDLVRVDYRPGAQPTIIRPDKTHVKIKYFFLIEGCKR